MAKKQKKVVLDEYEEEILEAYENGMLRPSKSQGDYQKIAHNTMKKNKNTSQFDKINRIKMILFSAVGSLNFLLSFWEGRKALDKSN